MKVKNTLEVDKIFNTLPDKTKNFVGTTSMDSFSRFCVRKDFPSWQYNGADTFDNVLIWCQTHLGNNFIWEWETIYFKTDEDKMFFLLRWL